MIYSYISIYAAFHDEMRQEMCDSTPALKDWCSHATTLNPPKPDSIVVLANQLRDRIWWLYLSQYHKTF